MIRLLEIQWIKLKTYKPFWVIAILYAILLVVGFGSVMPLMDYLASQGADFEGVNPGKIPVYYFPDIWQNITWAAGYLKVLPAFLLILMIGNEFSYKTIRQNIIDGLSRQEVVISYTFLALIISVVFTAVVGIIIIVLGSIYSQSGIGIWNSSEMLFGYFVQLFSFLIFGMLVAVLVKRSGLAVVLLVFYSIFELIFVSVTLLSYDIELFDRIMPLSAQGNLIKFPLLRYVFQEIQDYIKWSDIGIVLAESVLFIYFIYLLLRKRNLA